MTSSPGWGLARRFGLRFGVVFGALLIFPFPLTVLPKTDSLIEALGKPLEWAALWFATTVLGLPEPSTVFNGSGDRTLDYVMLLVCAIVAALGALAWSVLDRRRTAYPRLAAAAHVVLRYYLAQAMLSYGFSKILRSQFSELSPFQLNARVGDISPMGLLWRFMDYSAPYTVFAGLAEAIGGALLLWRRTATIGALVVIAVMTNVVMLNLCYDVPVKIYSTLLLVFAGFIALPSARRLLAVALGHAAGEVPPRVRMDPRRERLRLIAKIAMVAALCFGVYREFDVPARGDHVHELYGNWVVDGFTVNGAERPALATDAERWQRVAIGGRDVRIWNMVGTREPRVTDTPSAYGWQVDATSQTISVTTDAKGQAKETWRYARPDAEHLVIDGLHLGKLLHVVLHLERSPLLTRGFHWINEEPFNR